MSLTTRTESILRIMWMCKKYTEKDLKRAFLAGYMISEEGDNASMDKLEIKLKKDDHLYEVRGWQVWRYIKENFDEWLKSYL